MRKYFLLGIGLLFCGLGTYAQPEDIYSQMEKDKVYKNEYEKAEMLLLDKNFEDALLVYKKWDSIYPNNANLNFKIGYCYANMSSDKPRAIPYLEKASGSVVQEYLGDALEMNAPVDLYFYLAQAYHVDYKFGKAIENYDRFLKYAEFDNPEFADSVKLLKEKSYNAVKIINNPLSIRIENLGEKVNSIYPEYSPVLTLNMKTLYFTSRREGSTGNKKDYKGQYYEDVYYTSLENGEWSEAKHVGGKINTVGHEATISISPDGKTLFLYKDDKGDGNIYISELKGDEWSKPEKLPSTINSEYWETHACLSPDENTLYFVSDRPGGFGGRDIWKSEKIRGKWLEPENLGSTINTPYNEDAPYMLPDGFTLYFASEGHDNMGGFDIFISTISPDGFWSSPENIGYPINTTEDDIFYMPTPDEKHAFYSSSKNYGMGGQDLYYITIVKPKKKTIMLRGRVADATSFRALKADVEIYSKTSNTNVSSLISNEDDGAYSTTLLLGHDYVIKSKADGYKMAEYNLSVNENEKRDLLILDIFLEPLLLAGDTAKADIEDVRVGEKIVLNNIFYDFDRATLRPESVKELKRLVKLMTDIPSLKIEISSHTDNVGSDEYNLNLSKKRAQSVVLFLIKSGIDENRLVAKGYGETEPIATNTTEEGRQMNRRTEFKILSK